MSSLSNFEEWERQYALRGESPAVPAATVVLLRDGEVGIETLLLRKSSKIAYGGMWVFPGGRIDDADRRGRSDAIEVARSAAVREAEEESGLRLSTTDLVHFAFWLPPVIVPRRFATWFFAARAGEERVVIDDGEITSHEWMHPADALRRNLEGEIELATPTWVTLHTVGRYPGVDEALHELSVRVPRRYETHVAKGPHGPVAMWSGDAGYESGDPSRPGPRHRLERTPDGNRFDESGYHDPG
jgi:8-oxo-dGTP pyrophosphatase MutT (NUDIX family)